MAFKAAVVVMAPDGDPTKHRATITTSKLELTTVVVEMGNFGQAADVCKGLVADAGVQSIILCPGFYHGAVAAIAEAGGEGVAVGVARGDVPSGVVTGRILAEEGWFAAGH